MGPSLEKAPELGFPDPIPEISGPFDHIAVAYVQAVFFRRCHRLYISGFNFFSSVETRLCNSFMTL
jgi:hypothetical protein